MKLTHMACLLAASAVPATAFLSVQHAASTKSYQASAATAFLNSQQSIRPSAQHSSSSSLALQFGDISIESLTNGPIQLLQGLLDQLHNVNSSISQSLQSILTTVLGQIQSLFQQEQLAETQLIQMVQSLQSNLDQWLLANYPQLETIYSKLVQEIVAKMPAVPSTPVVLITSAIASYSIISMLLNVGSDGTTELSKPYPKGKYDPTSARIYFDKRLPEAFARGTEIAIKSLGFGSSILKDKLDDKLDENQPKRALELAELLTTLGPTFIKIGQSLSIRTDLLSPAYVRGLASLQDQVKPFDTEIARDIMEAQWGKSVDSVLSYISPEPVAAASLGQVYKATTKDGREIAIKVQRPSIMNQVALDMHLLREIAPVAKRTFNLNTDTVGTVDAWGSGFVDELDYLQEALNAQNFMEKIQDTPLKDVVFAPAVVEDLSTATVLVTEWVDGERLDKSSNEDITVLCSIAMNSYLTMMLEIGLLHCDPHPGNLLRTPEGKLCILDWGMVTRLDDNLQLTLIEHMAHLTSADYEEIPRDLLLLGFIPEDKADLIEDSGVVDLLANIYGQWTAGGGAASVNVNEVISNLQDLTAEKGNLFQIPPYCNAYIAKSFSVLEGIGLSNDPKYSIINECLPYVSQRLLTDKSQMGNALNTFVFGPDKSNLDTRIVNIDRIEQLVTGFGNYTTSTSGAMLGKEHVSTTQKLETTADYLLEIIFSEEESPVQDILLEQLAKIVTSGSRSVWSEFRQSSGKLPTGRSVLGTIVDPLGLFRQSALVEMSDMDHKTVDTTRRLIDLMQTQAASNGQAIDLSKLQTDEVMQLSSILARKVWARRIGLARTGSRFATKLLKLTADKLEVGTPIRSRVPAPPSPTIPMEAHHKDAVKPKAIVVQPEPRRLSDARNRLQELDEVVTTQIDKY